jgi:hypothetical protein
VARNGKGASTSAEQPCAGTLRVGPEHRNRFSLCWKLPRRTPGGHRGRSAPPSVAGMRLLVVEDEEDAREALTLLLARAGAHVRSATSVRDARRALEEWPPDVVVTASAFPTRTDTPCDDPGTRAACRTVPPHHRAHGLCSAAASCARGGGGVHALHRHAGERGRAARRPRPGAWRGGAGRRGVAPGRPGPGPRLVRRQVDTAWGYRSPRADELQHEPIARAAAVAGLPRRVVPVARVLRVAQEVGLCDESEAGMLDLVA